MCRLIIRRAISCRSEPAVSIGCGRSAALMVGLPWRSHEPQPRRSPVSCPFGARILSAMDARTAPRAHALWPLLVGWLPVIAWAGLIFAFSAQPNLRFVPDQTLDFLVRKAGHMGEYGILALLLWRALATTTAWRWPGAWAVALAVLYAITDEFHQGLVAGRHESAVDVGIDAAGALIAVVAAGVIRARWTQGRPDRGRAGAAARPDEARCRRLITRCGGGRRRGGGSTGGRSGRTRQRPARGRRTRHLGSRTVALGTQPLRQMELCVAESAPPGRRHERCQPRPATNGQLASVRYAGRRSRSRHRC
jgi:VanZ family protein